MDTPIINPLWFYLIDTADRLHSISAVLLIILSIVMCIVVPCYLGGCFETDETMDIILKKIYKKTLVILIMLITIVTFIPCKETSYKMFAANMITPEVIENTKENVTAIIDYIIDSASKIEGKIKKENN